MSMTYARPIPVDRNGNLMDGFPPSASAIGVTARDNASTSSVTALTANTTVLEVSAVTTGAVIKWATGQATSVISAGGTANFDNFIPANTTRLFVVPRATIGLPNMNNQGTPSIVGLNTSEGLFANVATKSVGVGSVLVAQF